jgi:hypothetical protein
MDGWDVIVGATYGVIDNLTGSNLRATYTPNNASDYNGALDQADKTCVVFGTGAAVFGGYAATGGAVASGTGVGALVAVGGVAISAEGSFMVINATQNLMNGNQYGEEKKGPAPNDGNAASHGNSDHNQKIDDHIQSAKEQGATNVRKNQKQVDINGNKVGDNRPDAQYDLEGKHINYEVDRSSTNSQNHVNKIKQNDPNAEIQKDIIKK